MEIVRRIMIRDTVDGAVVRGKTGWAQPSAATPVSIGWWVGWIEKDGRTTFFATNLETDDPKKDIGPMRRQITEAVLREIWMM
jgi:beta-lactamase class D